MKKLTEAQKDRIRKLYRTRVYSQQDLAERYGVTQGHIASITKGINTSHTRTRRKGSTWQPSE